MDVVTVVNRSSKPVDATWDGRPYQIPANGKVALPVIVAEAAKRQNVIMGSEDPYTGTMEYLVGIVEQGDDITPIEQSHSITRMNRKEFAGTEQVVKSRGGMYTPADRKNEPGLPLTGGQATTEFRSR